MRLDIQTAGIWKRIAAWLLDSILICVLAVGFAFLLSSILGYDNYLKKVNDAYKKYEAEYGVSFDISPSEYDDLTDEEKEKRDNAFSAFSNDAEAMKAYGMLINLTLVEISVSLLLAFLLLEFLVPLLLGNGQTVGKKAFGIGIIRVDSVKISTLQLFVRSILGKYTVETMIPVYVIIMIFVGTMGIIGTLILAALILTQVIMFSVTQNHSVIHDYFSGTIAVDISSQMVFESREALIEYKKRIHAEQSAKQEYK